MTAPTGSFILGKLVIPFSDVATVDAKTIQDHPALLFCKNWLEGQLHFEISTSGSTGTPKSIRLSRIQMEASALATKNALDLRSGMNALLCLDPMYIAGMMMLVRAMVTEMNLVVVPPVANPMEHIPDHIPIDFAAVVPYQLKTMLESPSKARLNSWGKVIVGGGAVDGDLENQLKELSCQFYATYGMTETISHVALRRLNGSHERSFHALDGIQFSQDERGCLVIQANYLGTEAIVTNDLVDLLDDKSFNWLGRTDFVINTGGVKVVPEVVEEKLSKYLPSILGDCNFLIVGIPDKALGFQVTLLLDCARLDFNCEQQVLANLKAHLGRFECPKSILYSPGFVRTATGKIDRRASLETALPPLHPERAEHEDLA